MCIQGLVKISLFFFLILVTAPIIVHYFFFILFLLIVLLFICAYKAWSRFLYPKSHALLSSALTLEICWRCISRLCHVPTTSTIRPSFWFLHNWSGTWSPGSSLKYGIETSNHCNLRSWESAISFLSSEATFLLFHTLGIFSCSVS
jgi:hypothetical protein